ncbi:hypothetical protein LJC57_04695 [Parabacteroides sp. OttesenSCG-928-G07]|nr:hypothetical protein [Parabacteroides sp. OttesenSCG-928-G07]
MTKGKIRLLVLFFMLFVSGVTFAQEIDRKWGLSYTGSVLGKPVLTANPSNVSTGGGSSGFTLTGDYYLPKLWALQAGYFRTDLSYGDGERTMEGLQVGVKKYFINPDFIIQPYLSATSQINWSRHTEHTDFEYEGYSRRQITRNPRISFAPGVGLELYLFSSVAFVAAYKFHMGISSSTMVEVASHNEIPYLLKDKGMYHDLSLGVKVTFPFHFSGTDGMNLLTLILDMFGTALERHNYERYYYR